MKTIIRVETPPKERHSIAEPDTHERHMATRGSMEGGAEGRVSGRIGPARFPENLPPAPDRIPDRPAPARPQGVRGKDGAAEILGLKESTLRFRMKKLGIQRPTISANIVP